ncbi:TetR/AcrR family transcriptional regulator [Actinoplanes couchii]|uniref:HTH tetR-type domain-containing protein n=1 Tax=Actinoplanes couchii TaxID=403638 RepID=A0ABQ3XP08_9ACTN|nr:TetR/AcrR family transcriptional regulator [Actinoplanes couchii]MDR6318607.1 AcrR family transcriptional regulator [Actinoplanes couchii]GID60216.1 hypothetical protein Aco03nite_086200 [Actinoplanes couchii]
MAGNTIRTPQQDRSREKLERIYAVAFELLVEGGWDAVTVGEVERRSKVSRSTFYLRFPTREALTDYVRQRLLQEVATAQDAAFEQARATPPTSLAEAVHAATEALAGICRVYGPALGRLDFGDDPGVSAEAMDTLSNQFQAVIDPVLPPGTSREQIEFTIELVFNALVGRMRHQQPFPSHTRQPWDHFLNRLCAAAVRYLES